jgi:beta-lactamase regulating signal transducer with metallopeptidase domain
MMLSSLIRASVEGAVVVALVWIVSRTITALTPRARTALWWCAAAKFIVALVWIAPLALPILPAVSRPDMLPSSGAASASQLANGNVAAHTDALMPSAENDSRNLWAAAFVALWACGFLVSIGVGVRRWRQLRLIARHACSAPPWLEEMAADLCARLSLDPVPEVRQTSAIDTPLVTGVFTPLVLLPAERFAALSDHQQRMVLCHELTHVKRRDLWFGCAPALAERLFFFHPLVHVAVREYALWREAACDAAVVDITEATAHDYGRLLLDLGVSPRRSGAVAAGASWSFANLKRRIAMLRDQSPRSTASRLAAAVAVGIAVAALVPVRLTARTIAAQDPATVTIESLGDQPSTDQDHRDQDKESHLNYVLLLDEHSSMMSGEMRDVTRARQFKRPGEQVLWFRQDGREYIVRDPAVLEQVTELWKPVHVLGNEQGKLGGQQGALGAQQGQLGAQQGALGAKQGSLGARQGELGARQGTLASREPRTAAERQEIDRESRSLENEMRELDRQMAQLDAKMREFDEPMRKLGDQMDELGKQMDALGKQMDEASKRAESEMRALLDRLITMGAAQPVK